MRWITIEIDVLVSDEEIEGETSEQTGERVVDLVTELLADQEISARLSVKTVEDISEDDPRLM